MKAIKWKVFLSAFFFLIFSFGNTAFAMVRGIYITQDNAEKPKRMEYFINQAKKSGINTFVIDYTRANPNYTKSIEMVKANGIRYIARIVIFPDGAKSREQMFSNEIREKKFTLMKQAVALGAEEIQIDYIRYSSKNRPSEQNVQDVNKTVKWYKDHVATLKVPLQIDVFGITSLHHELRIGQYPKVFVGSVDQLNPMVYPSHYEPYRQASAQPYKTIHESLASLKEQLRSLPPVKIIPFIEASNYRYKVPSKAEYVRAQMKAVEDSNMQGWYVWSANNIYEHVFHILQKGSNNKTQVKFGSNTKPVSS